MSEIKAFFHAMAPILTANILTATLVYSVAILERPAGSVEEGRGTYVWLAVMVLLLMLYGLYTWKVMG